MFSKLFGQKDRSYLSVSSSSSESEEEKPVDETTGEEAVSHSERQRTNTSPIPNETEPPVEMSSIVIKPPKPFSAKDNPSEEWKRWRKAYEWFESAAELSKKSEEVQAATFMNAGGQELSELLETLNISDDNQKKVAELKKAFEDYYVPQANLTYERYIFNKLGQQEGEKFDEFLVKIKTQAKRCDFGTIHDSLVKDKIVIGVINGKLREKLLTKKDLTLTTAIDMCRASEKATKQAGEIANEGQMVNAVEARKWSKKGQSSAKRDQLHDEKFDCNRCGTKHGRANCPAFNKRCSKCNQKGHFASVCRTVSSNQRKSKSVNLVDEADDDVSDAGGEDLYMDTIGDNMNTNSRDWTESLKVGTHSLTVKLDTGAQCNAIAKETAKMLNAQIVQSKTKRLISFSDHSLKVIGETTLRCKARNGTMANILFKVVNENVKSILGSAMCEKLNFIARIRSISGSRENSDLFKGLGCYKNYKYELDFIENPKFKKIPPRTIPAALRNQVKEELNEMVKLGVISPITEPSPAVSPMLIVKKKPNNKLRICLDPTELNKNILRREFPLKTLDEIATRIGKSKWFTILDCNKGFWQIEVAESSRKYLTFATPFGRYCCNRLPFGISSAPEVFSERMNELLQGIANVECAMDDILIHAETSEQLEEQTKKVLERFHHAGLTLNKSKCVFQSKEVKFLGHILSEDGLKIDPEKVEAIQKLETPSDKKQLLRLLGMVTYLSKFVPNLSSLTEPMRRLLKSDVEWLWDTDQQEALKTIKNSLVTAPVLRYFDVRKHTTLSVDASSKAMGATILQEGLPVAYATKAFTPAQELYPQIEKEACAVRFGCKKFHDMLYGLPFSLETDHKPLESIFLKPLHHAPARLQKILYDVLPYAPKVKYVKGSTLHIADTLSRDCEKHVVKDDEYPEEELIVQTVLTMTDDAMARFIKSTASDPELQDVIKYVQSDWPKMNKDTPDAVKRYFTFREELTFVDQLLFKGEKLVVPKAEREHCLQRIHAGHPGIVSAIKRGKLYLFWPNQVKEIQEYVEKCRVCQQTQRDNNKEPIFETETPTHPFELVSTDLFQFDGKDYIVLADSYSGYLDFKKLKSTSSYEVIECLKAWFSVHGVPRVLKSDNGPQYSSAQFKQFSNTWNFQHITSSPHFPRSNGFIERHVQVAKGILKKCKLDNTDVQLALLHHRLTPRNDALGSPTQRLMGRLIRSNLPISSKLLQPTIIKNVPDELRKLKTQQKRHADPKKIIPDRKFEIGENIRVQQGHRDWVPGTVVEKCDQPRSYIIQRSDGSTIRRNTHHLHPSITNDPLSEVDISNDTIPAHNDSAVQSENLPTPSANQPQAQTVSNGYATKYGRVSKRVIRYPNN